MGCLLYLAVVMTRVMFRAFLLFVWCVAIGAVLMVIGTAALVGVLASVIDAGVRRKREPLRWPSDLTAACGRGASSTMRAAGRGFPRL